MCPNIRSICAAPNSIFCPASSSILLQNPANPAKSLPDHPFSQSSCVSPNSFFHAASAADFDSLGAGHFSHADHSPSMAMRIAISGDEILNRSDVRSKRIFASSHWGTRADQSASGITSHQNGRARSERRAFSQSGLAPAFLAASSQTPASEHSPAAALAAKANKESLFALPQPNCLSMSPEQNGPAANSAKYRARSCSVSSISKASHANARKAIVLARSRFEGASLPPAARSHERAQAKALLHAHASSASASGPASHRPPSKAFAPLAANSAAQAAKASCPALSGNPRAIAARAAGAFFSIHSFIDGLFFYFNARRSLFPPPLCLSRFPR